MFLRGDLEKRIRERAYWIWTQRMEESIDGDAVSDWLEAERIEMGLPPQDPER